MNNRNPNELLEIDLAEFRRFYARFADGRTGASTETGRQGSVTTQINDELLSVLGSPPTTVARQRSYWLGSKSSLEDWKLGKTSPGKREWKVLQAIYVRWGHDISQNRDFTNRVVVDPAVQDFLLIDGIQFEPLPGDGERKSVLRLKKLELTSKVRRIRLKKRGREMEVHARLGFSEISLSVTLPEGIKKSRVPLDFLTANQGSQFGTSLGMNVTCDVEGLKWRLIGNRSSDLLIGSLTNAQLVEVLVGDGDAEFRVEIDKADFDPEIYLDSSASGAEQDKQKTVQKKLLIAHVLRRRLAREDGYVLASGKLKP